MQTSALVPLTVLVLLSTLFRLASPKSILAPSRGQIRNNSPSSSSGLEEEEIELELKARPAIRGGIDGFYDWPVESDLVTSSSHHYASDQLSDQGDQQQRKKKGYKAEGDAYIRFGKRAQEFEQSLNQDEVSKLLSR